VTPAVLVPRPETELLVEVTRDYVRALYEDGVSGPLCDMGTGSGCVAVALASELARPHIWAVDVSDAALDIARSNARRHGVCNRLQFVRSDLFESVPEQAFVAIVANPPYVATQVLDGLEPELAYEPRVALNGGEDGLGVVRRLIASSVGRLAPQGGLIVEIGADQGPAARACAMQAGFAGADIRRDLSGNGRVLVARR
jgi:release factor glutamine methyltransferase